MKRSRHTSAFAAAILAIGFAMAGLSPASAATGSTAREVFDGLVNDGIRGSTVTFSTNRPFAIGAAATTTTSGEPPSAVSSTEFGARISAAMTSSDAFLPGTTLSYVHEEPNGGMGGVWPLTETSTVNPDGSLAYRLVARGELDGKSTTLVTDLRCTSGSTSCWKRDPYEFHDRKWHKVPHRLVLYHETSDETVFADGPWDESDDYSIARGDGGVQLFTRVSGSSTEKWTIGRSSVTYSTSCPTCGGADDGTLFRVTFTSSHQEYEVAAPRHRFIGSAGDRPGYGIMFPVYVNR